MFNPYVEFVLYNAVGFLIALVVWNWLPKPKPYDYTTIPGHKLDLGSDELPAIAPEPGTRVTTISSTEGHMAEIRQHQSFRAFHRSLHSTFGPLASFHWGPRYIISVGSLNILKQLQPYEDSLLALPAYAIFNILLGDSTCWTRRLWRTVQSPETVVNSLFTNKKEHTAESTSRRLLNFLGIDEDDDAVRTVEELLQQLSEENQERALMTGPFGKEGEKTVPSLLEHLTKLTPSADGCEIMCDLSSVVTVEEAQRQTKYGEGKISFSHFLNALKRPLVIAFDKEIDIDGHPVPAYIPILLCMEDIIDGFLLTVNQCTMNEIHVLIEEHFGWIPGPQPILKCKYLFDV